MKFSVGFCGGDLPWEDLQVIGFRRRNTNLLKSFAEHPDVEKIYVYTSVKRTTFFRKTILDWRKRQRAKQQKVRDVYITALIPQSLGLPGSTFVNSLFARFLVWLQIGTLRDDRLVVWCYLPKGYRLAQLLKLAGAWVVDTDNNIIEDINVDAEERAARKAALVECARDTKLIVTSSRRIIAWYADQGVTHCGYIRNAVDVARFQDLHTLPADIQHVPRPRIGYVGVLQKWIDFGLLAALARRRPDWSFIIVGHTYNMDPPEGFAGLANVTFLGSRSGTEVPNYIAAFDVTLSLYKPELSAWQDGDSMKIFEYLAAGVPTVATPNHSYLRDDFDDLLQFGNDAAEFEAEIEKVLAWSAEQRAAWDARRKAFLEKNTWACRAQEAIELFNTYCFE